jgi:hypothetical protein
MKTAEEHIRNFWGEIRHDLTDSQGRYLSAYDIKLVIEQAQKEAYNEAIDVCIKNASADVKFAGWGAECQLDASECWVEVNKYSMQKLKK